ncbi:rhodanese-like domain-containing protein [Nanoarchaeota archaeon]
MKKVLLFLTIISLILIVGCSSVDKAPDNDMDDDVDDDVKDDGMMDITYMDVSAAEAKALIDSNSDIIIIDVSLHYANGHLPGAVSYYIGDGSLDAAIPTLDKEATYLVYCHVDSVAIAGAQKLIDAGFTNVYRLVGNYGGWIEAGYPIEK